MGDFQKFKKDKVLIVVEDGIVSSVIATDNIEIVLIDKDQDEFTNFYEADALDEVVDHEVIQTVIDEIIKEFHEESRTRKEDEQEEEDEFN
jgi:hypothetical protein